MRTCGGGGGGAEIAVAALRRHAAPAPLPALPAADSGAVGAPVVAPAEGDAAAGELRADGGAGFSLAAMRLLAREAEARAEALNEQGSEAMRTGRWRPGPIDSDAAAAAELGPPREMDETRPVSTGEGTRRVQLVRGKGRDVSS